MPGPTLRKRPITLPEPRWFLQRARPLMRLPRNSDSRVVRPSLTRCVALNQACIVNDQPRVYL